VQFELTRYLSDNWVPVIETDVDGPNSLPLRLDGELPNLGKFAACRRVARAIYLGSAPTTTAAHRGIEDRRVKLACVMPGETPAVFGDALRRLAGTATYLYQDGPRYWYSTQPTVTKLADDRAEQLKRNPDKVVRELDKRLRADLRKIGDFSRVHPLPQSGQDVADDFDARLVVLGIDQAYSKEQGSGAEAAAKAILEATLNLDQHQVKQADTQKAAADGAVTARLPETYQWLLVPVQSSPQAAVEWQSVRLSGQDALAVRASKKLRSDEHLVAGFAPTRLRMELDRVPLWRGDHVAIKQFVEDFARYLYLPRLKEPAVLLEAIRGGLRLLTWSQDSFAYAESFDDVAGRYRGLRCGVLVNISEDNLSGLLVHPDVALKQHQAEMAATPRGFAEPPGEAPTGGAAAESQVRGPKRFHGSVNLDPAPGRPRCRAYRRRGDLASRWTSGIFGESHLRNRRGGSGRNSEERRAHCYRE
jgi:hypothetical protein